MEKALKFLKRARHQGIAFAAILVGILALDQRTPRGFSVWVLYLLVVILATRFLGKRRLWLLAGFASGCAVIGFLLAPPGHPLWVSAFSRSFGIILLWAIVGMELNWRDKDKRLRSLQKAVSGSNDIVFMTDPKGVMTFINPAFTQTYGYTEGEVLGKATPRILKGGQVDPEVYKAFWEMLLEKKAVRGEFINKTKDGRLLTVEVSASPILDAEGNITGFLGIQRDVTEHKRAEAALRKNEATLAEAQRISHVGSWEWDLTDNQFTWSAELDRIFGFEPGSVVPTLELALNALDPGDREPVKQALENSIHLNTPYDIDFRVIHPDGTQRFVHSQAKVVRNAAGKPLRMVGTLQDITERKRAEEELYQSRQMLQNILDTIPQRVFWKDRNISYLGCNKAFAMDAGLKDPAEIMGKNDSELAWRESA